MPPVSSQTIIDRGEYLEPEFDANTLQIPQMRGLFMYHRVPLPPGTRKVDYVNQFNALLRPRQAELKRERENALRKEPSDDGIVDGMTGRRIGGGAALAAPRRSSRRSSRAPEEQEEPAGTSVSTRRQRTPSTPVAESSTTTRRRGVPQIQPKVEEESEPEEEEEPPQPPRRVVKKKPTPTAPAGQSNRRKAPLNTVTEDEDADATGGESAWETNNPFQSGPDTTPERPRSSKSKSRINYSAEPVQRPASRRRESDRNYNSSSPAPVPAPETQRRPSSASKPLPRERVEVSIPPFRGYNPPLERIKSAEDWQRQGAKAEVLQEPARELEEEEIPGSEDEEPYHEDDSGLISNHLADISRYTEDDELVPLNDTPQYKRMVSRRSPGAYPHDDEEDQHSEHGEEEEEVYNSKVSQKFAKLNTAEGKKVVRRVRRQSISTPRSWLAPTPFRFLSFLVVMWLGTALHSFKRESAYVGYCDAGSNTNLRILELQTTRQHRRNTAGMCIAKFNITEGLNNELCNPLPVHITNPFEPEICTACPSRAICTPDSVTCQPPFILKPHWSVKYVPFAPKLLDGMPLLGSVALPPTCVEDRERLRKIGGLVKGLEGWLARERGRKVCSGVKVAPGVDGGEAKVLGLEVEALRVSALTSTMRKAEDADDLFDKALAELEKYGAIIKAADHEGVEYAAAVRADFNLACRLRVEARNTWATYRNHVFGLLGSFLSLYIFRRRRINNAIEDAKVKDLVEEALDTLEDREAAYHADPVSVTEPYVVPIHLRDLILRDEHSPSGRQRVWEKVMKVVEGNANVRTNMEEVRGEDTKVWRWIGSTTSTPIAREKRRVSFQGRTGSGSLLKE
ncbi:inner nuclear membrane protein enriched at telomere/subtelomere region [Tulasnella sp. JGI-2019a]|nr:inner nuclear membrane protein enriched at telomere/subtelomere region [Tulasnella sp. JGI-2019a]KAG8990197.1 inner nuclear membrane protein enriched at telomere/subtelomere region [Tulasnella sp. JGI-2019a]